MNQRRDSIQLDDCLEEYLEKVSQLHQASERLTKSYSDLSPAWERIAAALHSLSDRTPRTR